MESLARTQVRECLTRAFEASCLRAGDLQRFLGEQEARALLGVLGSASREELLDWLFPEDASHNETLPTSVQERLRELSAGVVHDLRKAVDDLENFGIKSTADLARLRDSAQLLLDEGLADEEAPCSVEALRQALGAHGHQLGQELAAGGPGPERQWARGDVSEEHHDFWFIPREKLLSMDPNMPLPRAQTLHDCGLLQHQRVRCMDILGGKLRFSHVVVSHRWELRHQPDPHAAKVRQIQRMLQRRPRLQYVWLDWACAPQQHGGRRRSESEDDYFKQTLKMVNLLYLGCTVLVFYDSQYPGRFWPCIESWMGQQQVTNRGIEPEDGERSRLCVICLGSAERTEAEARAVLQSAWGQQSVDNVILRLQHQDVVVTNKKDKDVLLMRMQKVSTQLAETYQASVGTGPHPAQQWRAALEKAREGAWPLQDESLATDRDFMLALVRDNPKALSEAASLHSDRDFVVEAVRRSPGAFAAATGALRQDEELHAEALGSLCDQLQREEGSARLARLGHLVKLAAGAGHEACIGAACACVDDSEGEVRRAAVIALASLAGRGHERAIETVITALRDRESEVRESVWGTLTKLAGQDHERGLEATLDMLQDEESWSNRRDAARALPGLASQGNKRALEALIARVADRDSDVREFAVKVLPALAGQDHERAVKAAQARLDDEAASVRLAAARALPCLAGDACRQGILDELLQRLLPRQWEEDVTVREAITKALPSLAGRGSPPVLEVLLARLKDEWSGTRTEAARALSSLAGHGDERVLEALFPLLHDEPAGVREAATEALSALAGQDHQRQRVLGALLERLDEDNSWTVRKIAVVRLPEVAHVGLERALGGLLARLHDKGEDPVVRSVAAATLPTLVGPGGGREDLLLALRAQLADEPDAEVQEAVAAALAALE